VSRSIVFNSHTPAPLLTPRHTLLRIARKLGRAATLIVSVVAFLSLCVVQIGAAQKGTLSSDEARQLIDKVDRMMRGDSSRATVEMLVSTRQWKRTTRMTIWSEKTENVLIRIEEPKKDAGTATLRVGHNMWNYLPKIDRVVRVPTSMMTASWMGSHLTNDDLVKESRLIRDYDIATTFQGTRDGTEVYEFTLTPKPDAPVIWGRIVYLVRQADTLPIWAHFYSEDGTLKSIASFSDYAVMDGHMVPTRFRVTPQDKPGEFTEMHYLSLDFNVTMPANTFALSALRGS
jgi:outer membrane lipoprotein-sorting protein